MCLENRYWLTDDALWKLWHSQNPWSTIEYHKIFQIIFLSLPKVNYYDEDLTTRNNIIPKVNSLLYYHSSVSWRTFFSELFSTFTYLLISHIKLKLVGLFNVHIINHSGWYRDNHVLGIVFWPCLEMTYYQFSPRFFYMPLRIQWHGTATTVIIRTELLCIPPTQDWIRVNSVPGEHVTHSTTRGIPWRIMCYVSAK